MHTSSFIKAKIFVDEYAPELPAQSGQIRVLEVGSKSYHDQDTYRGLFPAPRFSYTGLDIRSGDNVDVVPRNPFISSESDCSFECCVSAQTFEHDPFFWITFAEIARVLVPGGISFIAAPGGGPSASLSDRLLALLPQLLGSSVRGHRYGACRKLL